MNEQSLPRTEAGRAMLARGSNNWSGEGWIDRFRDAILAIEAECAETVFRNTLQGVKEAQEAASPAPEGPDVVVSMPWDTVVNEVFIPTEAAASPAPDRGLDAELDSHIPSGGEGMDGYGYVSCSCGWLSDDAKALPWPEHIRAALSEEPEGHE